MRILLTHHYWKDQKNAVWSPLEFPVSAIEQDVKGQYARLQEQRPPWMHFGDYCVFFHYRDEKDIFGRNIVPISCAFVVHCQNPEACAQQILPRLRHVDYDTVEMDIVLPTEKQYAKERSQVQRNMKQFIPVILLIFICLIGGVWFFSSDEKLHDSTQKAPVVPSVQSMATVEHEESSPLASAVEQEEPAIALQKEEIKEESVVKETEINNMPQKQGFCAQHDIIDTLYPCPKAFVEAQCGEVEENRVSFKEWNDTICQEWKKRGSTKYSKQELSPRDEHILKKFFEGR